MTFSIDKTDGAARAGTLITAHSTIKTPVFMPVGTVGAVKSLDAVDMMQILDAQIILGNTYHLYLRPGSKVVKELGGLHGFTKFNRSFLTDSGGFQAFSLNKISKPDENGIKFKSHKIAVLTAGRLIYFGLRDAVLHELTKNQNQAVEQQAKQKITEEKE